MSTSPASSSPPAAQASATHNTQGLIRLLTAGAGISVACIYLNHPLLGLISRDLNIAPHALGVLPTLTAAGYASGIFFFGPLGDRYDRRLVILWKAVLLTLALIGSCLAPNLPRIVMAAGGQRWSRANRNRTEQRPERHHGAAGRGPNQQTVRALHVGPTPQGEPS